ncbi:MAG: transposase [Bacillota bacterium]|nr:transposase [Bacillota bacterium]
MKIISSYAVKIKHYNQIFNDTIKVYQQAVTFFIQVLDSEWETLVSLPGKQKNGVLEKLTHRTILNPKPQYDFDSVFYKFPSYLRRAAIQSAIGSYSSYRSALSNWEKSDQSTKKPRLSINRNVMPVFYKKNTYNRWSDYSAEIKIYHRKDWVWLPVTLRKSDVDYIKRHCKGLKEGSPVLEIKGKSASLRFSYEKSVTLSEEPIETRIILSVDLGINNATACTAMLSDGTVIGRKIISYPIEKDQLNHQINRIKKQQQHGDYKARKAWIFANHTNRHISEMTANAIIECALEYYVDIIVFEHLDMKGKKQGSKRQWLHLWRKQAVQAMVTHKAHREGIRISRVNPKYTSALAFDGSGFVLRHKNNYSLCTFQTGKEYHTDLNAAYNIGARYYVREIIKSLPERDRLEIQAKVPELSKRSTCTLSSLINLNVVLKELAL